MVQRPLAIDSHYTKRQLALLLVLLALLLMLLALLLIASYELLDNAVIR